MNNAEKRLEMIAKEFNYRVKWRGQKKLFKALENVPDLKLLEMVDKLFEENEDLVPSDETLRDLYNATIKLWMR